MNKFDFIFSRDLDTDAEVIGVKNPSDGQLLAQLRQEFKGTILESIALTRVHKGAEQYHIYGTLDYDGTVGDLVSAVQSQVYDADLSSGQFAVNGVAPGRTPSRRL